MLECALTHRSASRDNNERLEFLGDSILEFVIADSLYQKYPNLREGKLSRLRSNLVRGDTLVVLANRFEIGNSLLLGQGERSNGGALRESILSDAFEAIVGAVYLDAGLDKCQELILIWFEDFFEKLNPDDINKDPKTELQEWLQARKFTLPEYNVVKTTGDEHSREFTVSCSVSALDELIIAIGKSRRKGEQQAATNALKILKKGQYDTSCV